MEKYSVPNYVTYILTEIEKAGHRAYLVGGCVRDMVMGRRPSDWDIATSALPDKTAKIFKKAIPTGVKYGTVTVFYGGGKAEVTTLRRENEYSDARRPDSVDFVSDIEEDLSRRDFTVNAMAMDILGNIIDPFGGREDIRQRVIRCVGDPKRRFSEDGLRMMRAVRFSAKLGFDIDHDTVSAILENAPLMEHISAERIRDELLKALMTKQPEKAGLFIKCGLLDRFLSKSGAMAAGTVLTAGGTGDFSGLRRVRSGYGERAAAFAGLLIKKGLIKDGQEFFMSLRFSKSEAKLWGNAAKIGAEDGKWDDVSIKNLLNKYGREAVLLSCHVNRVIYGKNPTRRVKRVLDSGQCWNAGMLDIGGADLEKMGFRGRQIGFCLEKLTAIVIQSPQMNEREILATIAMEIRDGIKTEV